MTKIEKKIFLDRSDDLSAVVDRLIQAPAERVIINIPRDSVLGKSIHNFQVLKRESITANKELKIESIDDHVLELSSLAGIEAENPVFKIKERSVTDILPRANFSKSAEEISSSVERESVVPKKNLRATKKAKKEEEIGTPSLGVGSSVLLRSEPPALVFEEENVKTQRKKLFIRPRSIFVFCVIFVFIFGGGFVASRTLPRATITIKLLKTEKPFRETAEVRSQAKEIDVEGQANLIIPGELLLAKKNIQASFIPHGKETVEAKANGILAIYNAFSSQPQTLVLNTRFESPDHKIFRLIKSIVVPGAKIVDGKIVASKIEASVVADQAGEAYNLGAVSRWTIPGFKGGARYEGFYAESTKPMTGGFVGERVVPTKEDIDAIKKSAASSLEDTLKAQILVVLSAKFKTFQDTSSFVITKQELQKEPDEKGNYNIFVEGEMRHLVFEEPTLKEALVKKIQSVLPPNLVLRESTLNYGKPTVDLIGGKMTFAIDGSLIFTSPLDVEKVRGDLKGLNESALKGYIFGLAGLEKANISFWPFWVHAVPKKLDHIKIVVE